MNLTNSIPATCTTSVAKSLRQLVIILAMLICMSDVASADQLRIDAVPGIPFGVGRIVIPKSQSIDKIQLETHLMTISDAEGRVLYPAIRYTQPLSAVRELLGLPNDGTSSQLHVHFLFKGTDPLQIKLQIPEPLTLTVVPDGPPIRYQRLLRAWWVRYRASASKQRSQGDYSPIVETFLTSMLSQRLGLDEQAVAIPDNGESLSMLLGVEKLRLNLLQEAVKGFVPRNEPLEIPLPAEIEWPNDAIPAAADNVRVEDIARRVPEECFYIRFAQFENYVWLRQLLEEYGGDLSRMVLLRGSDSQLNQRVENQLGLRESSLSRILGPKVISDMAMIGRDTFLQEGAAVGILFEAKNSLLKGELENQRKRRVAEMADAGATIDVVEINGTKVSFASTPDNSLRSYQAYRGNFHLVTNSRHIAARFLECCEIADAQDEASPPATPSPPSAPRGSLGDSAEFRYARSLIPVGEGNTLFAYLSRRFFEGLLSPQYQIELHRRLRSITDLELLPLATLAAIAEGHGNEPITASRLVQLGFVGSRVDIRSDGSFTKIVNGKAVDSLRGARGTYLPIPDTPVGKITQSEARYFQKIADFHNRNWREMDPVLIGMQRTALDDETERVEIQAKMLPFNKSKYGIVTNIFGPPTTRRIKALDNDIVSVQGFVDGSNFGIPPHHLYFGIRDAAPQKEYSDHRFLKSLQILRTAPAYIAAWPRAGFLADIGLAGRPVGDGYSKMLLGLFRLDAQNGFSLLSFDPNILGEVAPQLQLEEVATPAQLHIQVGDVIHSKFGEWANDLDYQRAWETSVGNVHLMHVLTQQLRVPMPTALEVAENLLNAELRCPLGGDYQLVVNSDGTQRWASSAWNAGKKESEANYVSPLMQWLRGLKADLTIEQSRIVARGTLDIQRNNTNQESDNNIKLPSFNLFGGFGGGAARNQGEADDQDAADNASDTADNDQDDSPEEGEFDTDEGSGKAESDNLPSPTLPPVEELPPPAPQPNAI